MSNNLFWQAVQAVQADDLFELENLIRRNIPKADERGFSLLHFAAQENRPRMIDFLIEEEIDPNSADSDGFSPLHTAVGEGNEEAVIALLRGGASLESKCWSNDNSTPLHVAAVWGHLKIAKILLAAGANVFAKDSEGNTPTNLALKNGHVEMADFLSRPKS